MSISALQTERACTESGLTKKPIASWLSMIIASYSIFSDRVFGDKVPASTRPPTMRAWKR